MNEDYRICTRCVMDTTDPQIVFDAQGVCNHCHEADRRARTELFSNEVREAKLKALVKEIKAAGKGREYDCVIGVSGGVDSTMVAYKVKQLGLRPLALHVDNGWNSELAVHNIELTVRKLNIDLHTIVLDWEEFRDLQLAFLRSSVANIEMPTDHALTSLLFRTASENGVKYVITGANVVTEAVMPASWMQDSRDARLIKTIHRRFAKLPLKTYPLCSMERYFYYVMLRRVKYVPILNYFDYNKAAAKAFIQKELGWRDYGGKHYESVFTRFFQAYILPEKFKMDKRKPHVASLVCSKQMTREDALRELQKPAYPPELFREDHQLFLKKMRLSGAEFESMMGEAPKPAAAYVKTFFASNRHWMIPIVKWLVKPKSLKKISPESVVVGQSESRHNVIP